MDEGGFIVDYIMPAGSSLEETNRVITTSSRFCAATPEVESTSRRTGLQLGLAAVTEANTGDIREAEARPRPRRRRSDRRGAREDQEGRARARRGVLAAAAGHDRRPHQRARAGRDQAVRAGPGAAAAQWAPQVATAIKKIPGVVDVLDGIENTISGPATRVQGGPGGGGARRLHAAGSGAGRQRDSAGRAGADAGGGQRPRLHHSRALSRSRRAPRWTRSGTRCWSARTGKTGTLGSLATVEEIPGQTEIRRENLQRNVTVTARFEGINLGDGMAKVQQAIDDLNLPPSDPRAVRRRSTRSSRNRSSDLAFVLVLAIVLVFTVLLFEFGNFAAPVAVIASALLSTCGVFLALLVTGTTFNLSSFMGLIMVIGIVAKNGILLLDADQRFRAEGMSAEESMIRAGERRLRPIMMTALATVAGMIPLALALGAGSQMLQPLAIAVIGGILASMVLSLVVTPAVHYYMAAGKAR